MIRASYRRLSALRRNQEGMAFLEFAICMPFLFALLLGAIEVTRYILVAQKVEKVATTLSDVVAQSSTVTPTELNITIQAAGQVMQPYTFSDSGYAIISSVTKTGDNPPVVNWQYAGGGTWTKTSMIGAPGGLAALPEGFTMSDKENVIITEVFYSFAPLVTTSVLPNATIYKIGLFKPRLGELATLSALPFWLTRKGVLL